MLQKLRDAWHATQIQWCPQSSCAAASRCAELAASFKRAHLHLGPNVFIEQQFPSPHVPGQRQFRNYDSTKALDSLPVSNRRIFTLLLIAW